MATYIELRNVIDDDTLRNRTDVAVVVAANNLLTGTPTTEEVKWAANVLGNPRSEGAKALRSVIAANKDATVEQITGATDAQLQANVDTVVPSLVVAFNS